MPEIVLELDPMTGSVICSPLLVIVMEEVKVGMDRIAWQPLNAEGCVASTPNKRFSDSEPSG